MDEKRNLSKKELKELRKIEEIRARQSAKKQDLVKWIVISVTSILFLVFFAAIIFIAKQNKQSVVLSSSGWEKGNKTAKVTLVEFGDFQCPACKAYEPMVSQIFADSKLKENVKLIFKHYPLSIHKNAMLAAKAAEAAGAQNKFWEFHDLLYLNQDEWSELSAPEAEKTFLSYAEILKIDKVRFKIDLSNKEFENKINEQMKEGDTAGVIGTPSFYVNNKKLESNPQNFEELKKILEKEIK